MNTPTNEQVLRALASVTWDKQPLEHFIKWQSKEPFIEAFIDTVLKNIEELLEIIK